MKDLLPGRRRTRSYSDLKLRSNATTVFCSFAIVCFGILTFIFIAQGIGLARDAAETSQQFVAEDAGLAEAAKSSWLLGAACIGFALGSIVSLMLSMRNRLIASWAMLGIFASLFILIVIVCKPA